MGLMVFVGGVVLPDIEHGRAVTESGQAVAATVDELVHQELTIHDVERGFVALDPERIAVLHNRLAPELESVGVEEATIWNREHWAVYSTNTANIGRWSVDAGVEGAFLDQVEVITVADDAAGDARLRVLVPVVVADQRVNSGSRVVGAADVRIPYAPIGQRVERQVQFLWLVLASGLLVSTWIGVRLRPSTAERSSGSRRDDHTELVQLTVHDDRSLTYSNEPDVLVLDDTGEPSTDPIDVDELV